MFLRFNPLSAIRDFPRRARQIRRLGPGRLPGDRTRRQFRLEGLEDRCLLSGISAITEFPLPSGSSLPGAVGAITTGPDGNIWFSDPGANSIGTINPSSHAVTLFKNPHGGSRPHWYHDRPRRQHLVLRA